MNNAFLNCYIWSVHTLNQPYINENFYLVESVYFYNSMESGIIEFNSECIQIPEFEIQDTHLLDRVDSNFTSIHNIPLLYKNDDIWKIDLRIYEDYKLQSRNIQQN
jgi:hypothetical protein